MLNSNKKNESYTMDHSTTPSSNLFSQLYSKFLNQDWPVVSSISSIPPTLNVAYPDSSIIYYVATFNSSDMVVLSGTVPPNIYFFSIVVYDSLGLPTSLNFTPSSNYNYELGLDATYKTPPGDYCVIVRVYKTSNTPSIYPNYVPKISINGGKIPVKSVSNSQRIVNSNLIQELLWKSFNSAYSSKTPTELFPNINVNEFFLPSVEQMASVFPNPNAKYLIVFPTSNNVIKVTGVLPPSIGYNMSISFISFMASNMDHTSTDDSISFSKLGQKYTLFVAYSIQDAVKCGYNPLNDKLLLWKSDNKYPLLIYREVRPSSTNSISTDYKALSLFTINNSLSPVNGSTVSKSMGIYYPQVLATSSPSTTPSMQR